jgi:Ca2+-binding RTX toxin-like protein
MRVRRVALLLAVLGLMVVLFAGAALAVVRVGDAGPNRLIGTDDNDTLRGRGDSDRLFGGRGGDLIQARERGPAVADLVRCGAGRDTVFTYPRKDTIRAGCEVIRLR